jgi:hypothetical protein
MIITETTYSLAYNHKKLEVILLLMPEHGYGHYILKHIERLPPGIPILTEEMVMLLSKEFAMDVNRAKKIVNTNLSRLNGKQLQHYKKGIYYKAKMTPFRISSLNPAQVIRKLYL